MSRLRSNLMAGLWVATLLLLASVVLTGYLPAFHAQPCGDNLTLGIPWGRFAPDWLTNCMLPGA